MFQNMVNPVGGSGGDNIITIQNDSISAGMNTKTISDVTTIFSVFLILANNYIAYGYKDGDSYSFVNPSPTALHMDAISGNQVTIGSGYAQNCTFYIVGQ